MCNNIKKIWLIGSGPMAIDYARVLNQLNINYDVIGRGIDSAKKFEQVCNKSVNVGGISNWLESNEKEPPNGCIVAVGLEDLSSIAISLVEYGIKNILVEKPGGLNSIQIKKLGERTKEYNANIYIGYNRRYYASTMKAVEIIKNNGGVLSFYFEFTEWADEIEKINLSTKIKENWFLVNSSHVADLAFFLGGKPDQLTCYIGGKLNWHPKGSIYSGAGVSDNGALFSYQANWASSGRWGVEVLTKSSRLILKPLEKLQIIPKGSIQSEYVDIDDELDKKFKPGLYHQTRAFINNDQSNLCTIHEQIQNLNYYEKINSGV